MGIFSKLIKKNTSDNKHTHLKIVEKIQLTADAVQLVFEVPESLKAHYLFKAGQYVNISLTINGKQETRSYSICAAENEPLSVGVKKVKGGLVSTHLVDHVAVGDEIIVSAPAGNFQLKTGQKQVFIAAGSGITPMRPLLASARTKGNDVELFYGNSSVSSAMFYEELKSAPYKTTWFFSQETVDGGVSGRINKETFSEIIKADFALLRADHFYICGPEEMIIGVKETLELFGVKKENIHFELFTTPVLMVDETAASSGSDFSGTSKVTAHLDGEKVTVELDAQGKTILEALDKAGLDVPYSCRGGVCCTCKAKIISGSAQMKINYALTDEEVKNGYILTCQAHPTSAELKIDFDA